MMKRFLLENIKPISLFILGILVICITFTYVQNYREDKLKEEIKKEKEKIQRLEKEAVFWKTKSEMFEKESKEFKDIVEKSKQNITTIINKYDEKRASVTSLNDDESIDFLSERLDKKGNSR